MKATRPNETWAMDFVHDQLCTGRKLRILTIVDTFSLFAGTRPFHLRGRSRRGAGKVGWQVGFPKAIRVDRH